MTLEPMADLATLLVIWALVAGAVFVYTWKQSKGGVGLVLVYLLFLVQTHLLPAVFYALPWYFPLYPLELVQFGFEQSLYGLIAFSIGAMLLALMVSRLGLPSKGVLQQRPVFNSPDLHLPEIYLGFGLVARFVLTPLIAGVPTITAVIAGLNSFLLAGQVLGCWRAWNSGNYASLVKWLLLAAIWPLVTTTQQGFLGFGAAMTLAILVFMVQVVGFRWWLVPVSVLAVYFGLSFVITYSENRSDIRAVVWSDETSLENRLAVAASGLADFQWFDLTNPDHFVFLDKRQAQNYYIGRVAARTSLGEIEFAGGTTIVDSLLMLIPRAYWQDKPIRSGGSQQVSFYTGVQFYGSTSVGMSQVLEFYINFGTFGVWIGLFGLGVLLAVVDRVAARNLRQGDWQHFALWYVPALGILQADSSLLSITVLSVSGFMAVILVNRFFLPLFQKPDRTFYPGTRTASQATERSGYVLETGSVIPKSGLGDDA